MFKQSAVTGAAKAQDSTGVNGGDVHPEVALSFRERLRGPHLRQLPTEQIQRNGIDPGAHRTFSTKLM